MANHESHGAPDQDAAVVDAARRGDRAALEAILRSHHVRIHALCRRITGDDDDALDATQEALIAVARGIIRFDGRSTISTWIYRVATNAALDEVRRRRRRPEPALLTDDDPAQRATGAVRSAPRPEPDVATAVAARVDVDRVLGTLPPEQRAAVVLRDLLGLDYAEIADVLEIPIGTVRSRIARGRAAVAGALGGDGDEVRGGNRMTPPERPNPVQDDSDS